MDLVAAPTPSASLTTLSPAPEPAAAVVDEQVAAQVVKGGPEDQARTAAAIISLLVLSVPLASAYLLWSVPGGADDWNRRITVAPFDLVLLLAVGWASIRPQLLTDLFRSVAVRITSAAYVVVFAVALAAHFSWLGVGLAVRLGAGLAVVAIIAAAVEFGESRRFLFGAVTVVGVLQAVLGMVQSARGAAFGIDLLDFSGPLYPFGTSSAGRGGLTHPYHLAVFLVMAQGAALLGLRHAKAARWPWLAALAVLGAGIAVTYTRAGAVGQVALVVCLLCGRADRRILVSAAVAVVLGLGIGGIAFGDGWMAKGSQTTGPNANVDSNRSVRLREAKELLDSSPVVGIGPGRYVDALTAKKRTEYLPAHNLVAQDAAELGVVGGALALAMLALLGLRVLRGGAWTGAVVLPMIPFLLLDAYPYVFATGLAAAAIWLGLARASLLPANLQPADLQPDDTGDDTVVPDEAEPSPAAVPA